MKMSYECSGLIKELNSDIKEFGNIDMYAFFEKIHGYTFLTNKVRRIKRKYSCTDHEGI